MSAMQIIKVILNVLLLAAISAKHHKNRHHYRVPRAPAYCGVEACQFLHGARYPTHSGDRVRYKGFNFPCSGYSGQNGTILGNLIDGTLGVVWDELNTRDGDAPFVWNSVLCGVTNYTTLNPTTNCNANETELHHYPYINGTTNCCAIPCTDLESIAPAPPAGVQCGGKTCEEGESCCGDPKEGQCFAPFGGGADEGAPQFCCLNYVDTNQHCAYGKGKTCCGMSFVPLNVFGSSGICCNSTDGCTQPGPGVTPHCNAPGPGGCIPDGDPCQANKACCSSCDDFTGYCGV